MSGQTTGVASPGLKFRTAMEPWERSGTSGRPREPAIVSSTRDCGLDELETARLARQRQLGRAYRRTWLPMAGPANELLASTEFMYALFFAFAEAGIHADLRAALDHVYEICGPSLGADGPRGCAVRSVFDRVLTATGFEAERAQKLLLLVVLSREPSVRRAVTEVDLDGARSRGRSDADFGRCIATVRRERVWAHLPALTADMLTRSAFNRYNGTSIADAYLERTVNLYLNGIVPLEQT